MAAEQISLQRVAPETAQRSARNDSPRLASFQHAPQSAPSVLDRRGPSFLHTPGPLLSRHDGPAEREAETTAAEVMQSIGAPAHSSTATPAKCGCSGHSAGTPCKDCAKKLAVQRSPAAGLAEVSSAPAVDGIITSPGHPLDTATRMLMEPRFGYDFSRVRIHSDAQSMESARALGAKAYTLGSHVVFGRGRYSPSALEGQRLIAHELTHVVQQAQAPSATIIQRDPEFPLPPLPDVQLIPPPPPGHYVPWRQRVLLPPPRLNLNLTLGSPQKLDLSRLDQELTKGGPLTQSQGEIGYGSQFCPGPKPSRGCQTAPAARDSQLPLQAIVYPRNHTAPSAPGTVMPPTTNPPTSTGSGGPSGSSTSQPPAPSTATPAPRAIVVGGIHGDEGGAPQHALIAERLQTELTGGLARDFDTILVPVMNPGGLADNQRTNRHGVDLNRNFPGLPNFPASTATMVEQPETEAVKNLIQILHPSRILVLHAQGDPKKGGVYADPVEGEARELACRMAMKMKSASTGNEVVPGNQLDKNICESRYPSAAEVEVTTKQSSLGAWGSASQSAGGAGAVVITHEIPDKDNLKNPLPEHGAGRSVDSMMPGIREFLLDNHRAPSDADALLTKAVTNTFLSGQDTPADVQLRDAISNLVKRRFDDMNAYYSGVWFGSQPAPIRGSLPPALSIVASTGVRDFARQAGIVDTELKKALTATSSESDIEKAILKVMETRSMPGFSRHHWGTDMDLVSAERTDWDPSTGRFRNLIPFLQEHAFRFGFFHPYTAGYTRTGGQPAQAGFPSPTALHYLEEPWHVSYWPIANVLQRLWLQTFTGPLLTNLIAETARAVRGSVPESTMAKVLGKIGLTSFQSNVAPSP